jgi:hypothetical protein
LAFSKISYTVISVLKLDVRIRFICTNGIQVRSFILQILVSLRLLVVVLLVDGGFKLVCLIRLGLQVVDHAVLMVDVEQLCVFVYRGAVAESLSRPFGGEMASNIQDCHVLYHASNPSFYARLWCALMITSRLDQVTDF